MPAGELAAAEDKAAGEPAASEDKAAGEVAASEDKSAGELAALAEVDPDTQHDWEGIKKRLGTTKTGSQLRAKWYGLQHLKSLKQCQVCGTKPAEMALLGECIRRWCPDCAKIHAPDAKRGGCFPNSRAAQTSIRAAL